MIINRRGFLPFAAAAGGTLVVGCGGPAAQHTGSALGEDALTKVLPFYIPARRSRVRARSTPR